MEQLVSRGALRWVVRAALKRGVPPADAEDIAVQAYERAASRFDPARGGFDAFYRRVAQSQIAQWWRECCRRAVPLFTEPTAVAPTVRLEEVAHNQQRLLDALDADERRLFAAWALQKHLPQGQMTAERAAETLGITVAEFNNGKRRLAATVRRLADEWGLQPRDFFSCGEGEGPRRRARARR
ncbi:MAG: hypothetical protein KTR31_33530 [Myxococcales bacterium]|nr:hypothetical protein [Myxococcales bacterium]